MRGRQALRVAEAREAYSCQRRKFGHLRPPNAQGRDSGDRQDIDIARTHLRAQIDYEGRMMWGGCRTVRRQREQFATRMRHVEKMKPFALDLPLSCFFSHSKKSTDHPWWGKQLYFHLFVELARNVVLGDGLSDIHSLCHCVSTIKMSEEALGDETKIRPRAARYMAMARFPDLEMGEN